MWQKELHKAIKLAGSQSKLAKKLGINRRVINNWLNLGINLPIKYAFLIEMISEGKVLAEKLTPQESSTILSIKRYCSKER